MWSLKYNTLEDVNYQLMSNNKICRMELCAKQYKRKPGYKQYKATGARCETDHRRCGRV